MRITLLISAVALLLAACGGSASSTGGPTAATTATTAAPTTAPTTTPAAQVVTIQEKEFSLDPAQLTVKAGTITFNLVDAGKFSHDLHIAPTGTTGEVGASSQMTAGGSATLTVTLAAGTYDMWCGVDSHRQHGMQGTITVTG